VIASSAPEDFAVGGPAIVAEPAEGFEAAAEAASDLRREPGVGVVEAAGEEIAFAGGVQGEKLAPALARIPFSAFAIDQQIDLAREACERGYDGAVGIVFDDELRDEDRVGEIRKRIVEALGGVHGAEGGEIGFGVGANEHVGSG
jgi:hypothetical protein